MRVFGLILMFFSATMLDILAGPPTCSDIILVRPGLSCQEVFLPGGAVNSGTVIDNESNFVITSFEHIADCDGTPAQRSILGLYSSGNQQDLAYTESTCLDPTNGSIEEVFFRGVAFDRLAGDLYVQVRGRCDAEPLTLCEGWDGVYQSDIVIKLSPLTPLLEIIQSFDPSHATIGFRVPIRPEGLPAADWFDTYYGDLTNPIDFTHAQPLQCGYPAAMPSVGDYLTVDDPLPEPAPGQGRYYVTAVSYQGQRRYGRWNLDGSLRGRSPLALPSCAGE